MGQQTIQMLCSQLASRSLSQTQYPKEQCEDTRWIGLWCGCRWWGCVHSRVSLGSWWSSWSYWAWGSWGSWRSLWRCTLCCLKHRHLEEVQRKLLPRSVHSMCVSPFIYCVLVFFFDKMHIETGADGARLNTKIYQPLISIWPCD